MLRMAELRYGVVRFGTAFTTRVETTRYVVDPDVEMRRCFLKDYFKFSFIDSGDRNQRPSSSGNSRGTKSCFIGRMCDGVGSRCYDFQAVFYEYTYLC